MANKSKQTVIPPPPRLQAASRAGGDEIGNSVTALLDWAQKTYAAAEKGDGFSGRALAQVGKGATGALPDPNTGTLPAAASDPPTKAEVDALIAHATGLRTAVDKLNTFLRGLGA